MDVFVDEFSGTRNTWRRPKDPNFSFRFEQGKGILENKTNDNSAYVYKSLKLASLKSYSISIDIDSFYCSEHPSQSENFESFMGPLWNYGDGAYYYCLYHFIHPRVSLWEYKNGNWKEIWSRSTGYYWNGHGEKDLNMSVWFNPRHRYVPCPCHIWFSRFPGYSFLEDVIYLEELVDKPVQQIGILIGPKTALTVKKISITDMTSVYLENIEYKRREEEEHENWIKTQWDRKKSLVTDLDEDPIIVDKYGLSPTDDGYYRNIITGEIMDPGEANEFRRMSDLEDGIVWDD